MQVPDHPKRDTVLAAVKDAARRRWRWPLAILTAAARGVTRPGHGRDMA